MKRATQCLDPENLPAVLDVFSPLHLKWCIGLIIKVSKDEVTARFIDDERQVREICACLEDPRLAPFGSHTRNALPPGVTVVASSSRPGQFSYLDNVARQKFGTPELAWQAYLEQHLDCQPVKLTTAGPLITQETVPVQAVPSGAGSVSSERACSLHSARSGDGGAGVANPAATAVAATGEADARSRKEPLQSRPHMSGHESGSSRPTAQEIDLKPLLMQLSGSPSKLGETMPAHASLSSQCAAATHVASDQTCEQRIPDDRKPSSHANVSSLKILQAVLGHVHTGCTALVIWLCAQEEHDQSRTSQVKSLESRIHGKLPWVHFCQAAPSGVAECHQLLGLVEAYGFQPERVVLAGTGHGAALALQAGLSFERALAGICLRSGWLCDLKERAKYPMMPILMCHDEADPVVSSDMAWNSVESLRGAGFRAVKYSSFIGPADKVLSGQLDEIDSFLQRLLPDAGVSQFRRDAPVSCESVCKQSDASEPCKPEAISRQEFPDEILCKCSPPAEPSEPQAAADVMISLMKGLADEGDLADEIEANEDLPDEGMSLRSEPLELCRQQAANQAKNISRASETSMDHSLCFRGTANCAGEVVQVLPLLLGMCGGACSAGVDPLCDLPGELLAACGALAMSQLWPDRKSAYDGPIAMFKEAYKSTSSVGSTTVLLAALDNNSIIHNKRHPMMAVLSIGNCELLLLRWSEHGANTFEILFRQVPRKAIPACLRKESKESVFDEGVFEDAESGCAVHCVSVRAGDIVVLAGPGSFQESALQEHVVQACNELLPPNSGQFQPQPVELLNRLAKRIAGGRSAQAAGSEVAGRMAHCEGLSGAMLLGDSAQQPCPCAPGLDVSVVVAEVVSSDVRAPAAPAAQLAKRRESDNPTSYFFTSLQELFASKIKGLWSESQGLRACVGDTVRQV